ncbi:hypothetical protein [Methylobacterium durans]|uniref:Uncharacterized protein n=1 Tax=Methylobacterium durans TaxID=2202825 RepID=A0A2U8W8U8_9HYPH|nr:hypothetical protein [Methylobacterium durans]AWN42555.1 hypothetical protein DK389_21170 [Methylobacterium durans]
MAFLRTLVFAFLAVAVAIAPAAPCTMTKHASRDHAAPGVPTPSDGAEAPHHNHHPVTDGAEAPSVPAARADGAGGGLDAAPAAGAPDRVSAAVPHQHHQHAQSHHKRAPACPATCCPLACQAALPEVPWSGAVLDFRPSEPLGMAREDGVADPRPVRIERPPRRIG